jgi:hypothetical protein
MVNHAKEFKKLKKLCPVPIVNAHDEEALGYYEPIDKYVAVNEKTILRQYKDHIPRVILAVLAHEIQHAICYDTKCECRFTSRVEYHAYEAELKFAVDVGDQELAKVILSDLDRVVDDNYTEYPDHIDAVKKLRKTKLYKQCKELAKHASILQCIKSKIRGRK